MTQAKQVEWFEQWKIFDDDELFLFNDWIFPYMAIYQKKEAIKILPKIINYRKILKNFQILKLFIPPIMLVVASSNGSVIETVTEVWAAQ